MKARQFVITAIAAVSTVLVHAAAGFDPAEQPLGYIAPAALNQGDAGAGLVSFVPKFDFNTWVGDLVAAPVLANGDVNLLSPLWNAATELNGQDWDTERFIVTMHQDGYPIPFRKDDLHKDQLKKLKPKEKDRVKFLRGDDEKEGKNFRVRDSVLADIIHSNPVYVGHPLAGYAFDDYPAFAAAHANRPGRVYVGANDGMLHAFDAATGLETFAYIPSMILEALGHYGDEDYEHNYFVDGPITVEDAFFNNQWHSVLVSGLGAGGRGLFALNVTYATDITDESNFSTGAGSRVMWEFTPSHPGGENLGYTYGRVSVVKLNNGQWAAVTSNGYLSDDGKASLLLLDVQDGSLIRELAVSDDSANGLSSPTLIDYDGDAVADRAYAGDLNGNVWRFDLEDVDPAQWSVGYGGTPLFEARSKTNTVQSITTALEVGVHPLGGVLVYAATGRLLRKQDASDYTEQAIYGIWDKDWDESDLPLGNDSMLDQSLSAGSHAATNTPVRTGTVHNPNWLQHRGWRLSLETDVGGIPKPGERVIQDIYLKSGRLNVLSQNPTITTGESWLLQINTLTGGPPKQVAFDLDGDGAFGIADNVDGNGDGEITLDAADRVMGLYKGFGLVSRATVRRIDSYSDVAITNTLSGTNPVENAPPDDDPDDDGGGDGDPEPGDEDYGLAGGHMDFDVASRTYALNDGATDKHTHEWDNDYGNVVDYMSIPSGHREVDSDEDLPGSDPNRVFVINVANAGLSPGGVLEINGVDFPVREWQSKAKRFYTGTLLDGEWFPVFKLAEPSDVEYAMGVRQLYSFRMKFATDTITLGGLHPTETGCIKSNKPGQNGEYRNGALTTQLLDASALVADPPGEIIHEPAQNRYQGGTFAIHDTMAYAVPPHGGHGDGDGLFWEAILFWHWGGGCFGADDESDYDEAFLEEFGEADTRVHDDPAPVGNNDPYVVEDDDDEGDNDDDEDGGDGGGDGDDEGGDYGDPDREPNTEHDADSDLISAGGSQGRLFWREWVPDN